MAKLLPVVLVSIHLIYEVAEDCHQLVVVARLEILPSEVVVFCFRSV